MKNYILAALIVLLPTITLLLGVHHLLIVPYIGPLGFLPLMGTTIAFGWPVAALAEHLLDRTYDKLQRAFP